MESYTTYSTTQPIEQPKLSRKTPNTLQYLQLRSRPPNNQTHRPRIRRYRDQPIPTHSLPGRNIANMISDSSLYSLAVFLGSAAMLMIVLYHFLEINAKDSDDVSKERQADAIPGTGKVVRG